MSYKMEGTIIKKFNTVQITETFKKREFVLEVLDGKYTQLIKFELTNDNVEMITDCKKGDKILVRFDIRGRAWKSDNEEIYFLSLNAWKIEHGMVEQSEYSHLEKPDTDEIVDDDIPF